MLVQGVVKINIADRGITTDGVGGCTGSVVFFLAMAVFFLAMAMLALLLLLLLALLQLLLKSFFELFFLNRVHALLHEEQFAVFEELLLDDFHGGRLLILFLVPPFLCLLVDLDEDLDGESLDELEHDAHTDEVEEGEDGPRRATSHPLPCP